MSFGDAFTVQSRVFKALLLRDMRTRFGRKLSGWLIMVLWPLSHLLFIIAGYRLAHRVAPIGTDPTIFATTGILPYILCVYPSRMMMPCLVQNVQLLAFPPVQILDIVFARGVLEIVNAFWVVAIFSLLLFAADYDVVPERIDDAILAILCTIYLGFAIGLISALLYKIARFYMPFLIGCLILMYLSSGAFIPVSSLPENVRYFVWFNPLAHCVEWLRAAFFSSASLEFFSPFYPMAYSTTLMFLGLVMERGMRPVLMRGI